MTDEELNRAVALARGWTPKPGSEHQWIMPDGRPSALPSVASSPAAWGALLTELPRAPYHYRVVLEGEGADWLVYIYPPAGAPNEEEVIGYGVDSLTGRALALAFLQAKNQEPRTRNS